MGALLHCEIRWQLAQGTPLGSAWHVRRFEFIESIDAPFLLRVQVDSDDIDLEVLELVGGELTLTLARGATDRRVHGVVVRSELLGTFGGRLQFALEVGPAVTLAGYGARSRIFQGMTVPEIVVAVLEPTLAPLRRAVELRLSRAHPVRDFVVQWRESDLEFVLRILADAGIACLFEHGEQAETTVLVDEVGSLRGLGFDEDGETAPTTVRFVAERGVRPDDEGVAVLGPVRSIAPSRFDVLGWDWRQNPPAAFEASDTPSPSAWPGPLLEDPGTRRLVELAGRTHLDETTAQSRAAGANARQSAARLAGGGDVLAFAAGRTFELVGHPLAHHDIAYLVTRVVHRASLPRSDEPGHAGDARYVNDFAAHPLALGHSPARRPRPRADGLHSAVVVGPPTEEVHTDEGGRIKVRFPWNREAPEDDGASCWLRCVLPWAGAAYGAAFVPRLGMEVMVAFIDGDPDRPVCTGCVYNGAHSPPYALPEHKTRSGLRTSSSPGGAGHNELYFEDAAGSEEIHLHAQRNLREVVRADHATHVGRDQSLEVGRDQTVTIGRDHSETIRGNATRVIEGADDERVFHGRTTQIDGAEDHFVHKRQFVYVGCEAGEAIMRVNGARRVQAADAIELSCGPLHGAEVGPPASVLSMVPLMTRITVGTSSIMLLPDRIVIAADTIVLNSKGAAVELDERARVRGCEEVSLARGAAFDAANRLQLDGDVALHGNYTTVSGDTRVALVAVEGTGIVSLDAAEVAVHHDSKARIEDGGGGFVEIAQGLLRANQ